MRNGGWDKLAGAVPLAEVLGARLEEAGGTLHVLVDFTDDGVSDPTLVVVELFSEASPSEQLRESVGAWVAAFEHKLDPTRNF